MVHYLFKRVLYGKIRILANFSVLNENVILRNGTENGGCGRNCSRIVIRILSKGRLVLSRHSGDRVTRMPPSWTSFGQILHKKRGKKSYLEQLNNSNNSIRNFHFKRVIKRIKNSEGTNESNNGWWERSIDNRKRNDFTSFLPLLMRLGSCSIVSSCSLAAREALWGEGLKNLE